jgi:hypothetical protein
MNLLYSIDFVLLLACAGVYYKAADVENVPPLLWAGLSAAIYFLTWRLLGWGIIGNLFGQGLLLAGITIFRVIKDSRKDS